MTTDTFYQVPNNLCTQKMRFKKEIVFYVVIDRFHCHATKKNQSNTIRCIKLQNWDVIEDKEIRHLSKF